MLEEKASHENATLERIKARAAELNLSRIGRSDPAHQDDLLQIRGIGPLTEKKLHAIGIYELAQIANFSPEDEAMVNEVIEFFPGRIRRDRWKEQARALLEARQTAEG
ncbi:MAG: hypothetical protein AAF206_05335 [Bacteroidota bacterium]